MKQKRKEANLIAALVMTAILLAWAAGGQAALLYDNGPLVNGVGTHPGGGDETYCHSGLSNRGFTANPVYPFSLSDNFTIAPNTTWSVSSFRLYAYQPFASSASIVACYLRIWDGKPSDPGSAVVWGDNTTNIMSTAALTNIYAVLSLGAADNSRIVQDIVAHTDNLTLDSGNYWAEWLLPAMIL